MSKPIYIIYKHTCIISHKSYIGLSGQSIKKRWNSHICSSKNNSNCHFHIAIRKYGIDNFIHEILFTTHNQNIISEAEIFLIDYFDTFNTGYNMTIGGSGFDSGKNNPMYGKKRMFSKEHREKLSKASKNKNKSPEHCKNISKALKGKNISKEHREKLLNSIKGTKHPNWNGYWITPYGKFKTRKLASTNLLPSTTLSKWCKQNDKIISNISINSSLYLQSLIESPLGKTFRDIGFDFESNNLNL